MNTFDQEPLTSLLAVGGKRTYAPDENEKYWFVFCPGCGWKLTGKFSTCPRCRADLRTKECPYCKGMIPAGEQYCPRCTANFTD